MESRKFVRIEKPFVATPISLARLVQALPQGETAVKLTVSCVDGTTLYPSSLDELLDYPNPKSREIAAFGASARTENCSWSVDLSAESVSPVSYVVSGEDAVVVAVADILERHLEPMTSGNLGFLSTSNWVEFFLYSVFPVAALIPTIAGLVGSYIVVVQHRHLVMGDPTAGFLLLMGLVLWIFAANGARLRKYFFPRGVFRVGDGELRYEEMVGRRKLFGLSAVIALFLSVAGGIIANRLTRN